MIVLSNQVFVSNSSSHPQPDFDRRGDMVIVAVTHLLHVLWLGGGGVPAVVEDEDVWAGQTLIHLVEEELLL